MERRIDLELRSMHKHTLTFSKMTSGPATPETVLYSAIINKDF